MVLSHRVRRTALAAAAGLALLSACSRAPEPASPVAQAPEAEAPTVELAGGPPPGAAAPVSAVPAEAPVGGAGQDQPLAPAEPAAAPLSDTPAAGEASDGSEPATASIAPLLDRDPLQPLNRRLYGIDRKVTRVIDAPLEHLDARPAARPAVRMARNAFANLDEPATVMNDILQRKPKRALQAAARFVINSTVGVIGLFDVAERAGLHRARQDFGRTLGAYGVKPGPFVYLPLIGPTNPRDFLGGMVDALASPTHWLRLPVWEPPARSVVVRQLRREELRQAEARLRTAAPVAPADDYTLMRRAAVVRRARQMAEASAAP